MKTRSYPMPARLVRPGTCRKHSEALAAFSTLPVEGWPDYLTYLLEGLEDLAGDTPAFEGMLQELRERITARRQSGRWGRG